MKTRAMVALAAVFGAAAAARAQTYGTATYSLQFGNGLSNITLAPGQSTTVTVSVTFIPGPGTYILPLGGEVLGLSYGGFSITGTPGGGNATGNFAVLPGPGHPSLAWPYNFLPGIATNQGTSAGNSHNGVVWGHLFIFTPVHPLPEDPATIWSGTFTMDAGSTSGRIDFTFTGLAPTGVDMSSGPVSQGAIPWVTEYVNEPGVGGTIVLCYPDCTADGALTAADFGCFQTRFVAGDPYADCNADEQHTVADFACFQTRFVTGCP